MMSLISINKINNELVSVLSANQGKTCEIKENSCANQGKCWLGLASMRKYIKKQ